MKKIAIVIIGLVLMMSCNEVEKPFIITSKWDYHTVNKETICRYGYKDARGKQFNSYDKADLYNLGDTIK